MIWPWDLFYLKTIQAKMSSDEQWEEAFLSRFRPPDHHLFHTKQTLMTTSKWTQNVNWIHYGLTRKFFVWKMIIWTLNNFFFLHHHKCCYWAIVVFDNHWHCIVLQICFQVRGNSVCKLDANFPQNANCYALWQFLYFLNFYTLISCHIFYHVLLSSKMNLLK